ncbi:formylglycine-generating enzyme family protein [Engelhardtia mirabilis]|uniref:Serine/threonine-protein kinase pkn1 n=1 Tax=Engelhardtia mirabilis TaxID=2528011 RepID=A0A518BF70_9BACT|nr:Serine/threonine-protein kinase pkn1 [Planctomycetes bacterium Pla133]QDU99869.1 Serine/threonine-protein kinase pkn1 [Planctomycetes bacterium Pla86]
MIRNRPSLPALFVAGLMSVAGCASPTIDASAGPQATTARPVPVALDEEPEPFTVVVPGSNGASIEFLPLPPAKPGDATVWLARTELTWDCYGPWLFRFDVPEERRPQVDVASRPTKPYGAVDRGFGYEGHPVIGMTAPAATKYPVWLAEVAGGEYRLPTEAEWERACLAGGDPLAAGLQSVAWTFDDALDRTHPVASKAPNAWGFYDMLGNVGEWCTTAEGGFVLRGGSFNDFASEVAPGLRQFQTPAWNRTDPQQPKSTWWLSDGPFVGMRLVCVKPPPPAPADDTAPSPRTDEQTP